MSSLTTRPNAVQNPPDRPVPRPRPAAAAQPAVTELTRSDRHFLLWIVLASFGANMAFLVPITYSLALRIEQLIPNSPGLLGYVTGAAAVVSILTGPLIGSLSDNTRSRLGRRAPWAIGGILVGLTGLLVMAQAPNVPVLAVGWVLGSTGWGAVSGAVGSLLADHLPAERRGRASAMVGLSTQLSAVTGIGLASVVNSNNVLLFLGPGVIGTVLVVLLLTHVREADSRALRRRPRPTPAGVLATFVVDPRRHPAFARIWAARFLFFFGLSANTTFATFFYAQRLGRSVAEIAGLVAVQGFLSIATITVGTLGAGFLADRSPRRDVLALIATVVFAAGGLVSVAAHTLPLLLAGTLISSLGIGAYMTIGQAMVLDSLPEDKIETGRLLGVMGYAQNIPDSLAPLIAPTLLAFGAAAGQQNYTLLYLLASAMAVISGLVLLTRGSGTGRLGGCRE